jgi:hypothetical protein
VGRRGLRANRLVCKAVTGHDCPRAAGRLTPVRERKGSRAVPSGALATGCRERRASNDARATGRARTPVRRAARRRVGDLCTRAAVCGLVVVRVIRCRSFGLFCSSDGCSSGGSLRAVPFAVLPFARCDSLLVFAWRVVRGRGGRERLREPPEAHRFSSVKVFTWSRAVLAGLGPYFFGRRRRWLAGHSAARSVLAALPWPCAFRPSVERSCRALHSWARGWRWLRHALLWLADCTHQLRIGPRRGSSFNAFVMSSALPEFPDMRAAALYLPGISISAGHLCRVSLSSSPRRLERPRRRTISTSSSIPIETAASHRSRRNPSCLPRRDLLEIVISSRSLCRPARNLTTPSWPDPRVAQQARQGGEHSTSERPVHRMACSYDGLLIRRHRHVIDPCRRPHAACAKTVAMKTSP